MTTRTITNESIATMHPRQAAILSPLTPEERYAVLDAARFLQNVSGGVLSGCMHGAAIRVKDIGAQALLAETSRSNAKLMGWDR